MLGRLSLAALACVFLTGVALSLAIYIIFILPTVHAHAETIELGQTVTVSEVVTVDDLRDGYDVVPSPVQAVGPTDDTGGPFLTREIPSPEQATCQEDDPCWDCRFDGNERCGVEIEGVWYIIQFRDGSPESVSYR